MYAKPNLFISACIEHESCRYDASMIGDSNIKELLKYINVYRVCPEMSIGLPAPRESLRLIEPSEDVQLVQSATGKDFTKSMSSFAAGYLSRLKDMDGFILKAKSPSCGTNDVKIYYGTGKSHTKRKGNGLFGGKVLDMFSDIPVETERRLSNFAIRERFYISIFILAAFREIQNEFTYKKLVEFHSVNKYLFMTYSQARLKKMGNLVANHSKIDRSEVLRLYGEELKLLLTGNSHQKNRINVLTHIYGYFKNDITSTEKEFYFDNLDQYLNNHIPYRTVLNLLHSWAIRFQNDYLMKQTIFAPYPKELLVVTDSGKVM